MTIRQICVNLVSSAAATYSNVVTCTNPAHTPTGPGTDNHVVLFNVAANYGASPPTIAFSYSSNMEYTWTQAGSTFDAYCDVLGSSGSVTLPSGSGTCCGITPSITYSATIGSITTTSTMVQGTVSFAFTVTNLCSPTIICVDDTTCPS